MAPGRSKLCCILFLAASGGMLVPLRPAQASALALAASPRPLEPLFAAATAACDGTGDGTWNGCRGTGCHVCQEKLAGYDCYFQNHPNCILNTTCAGLFYDCDAACPAPTASDQCTSCQADTCTSSCTRPGVGVDNDGDAVSDQLEYDLAYRYFPDIWLQHFGTDLAQAYVYNGKAIPFTVQPLPPGRLCDEAFECLEIRFGLAYFNDTGDPTWGGGHPGDSEFYAVLVQRTASWPVASGSVSYWQMIRDFTAAHWRSGADSSRYGEYGFCPPNCHQWDDDGQACRNTGRCVYFPGLCSGGVDASHQPCSSYGDEPSCYFAGGSCNWIDSSCGVRSDVRCYATSPRTARWITYAAEGKHALYHTDSECDGGGVCVPFTGCTDECPTNAYNMRSYISGKLQNVGDTSNPGFVDTDIQDPDNCRLYGVWSDAPFGEASSYKSHLLYPLSWDLP